jgi:hypothetical protein
MQSANPVIDKGKTVAEVDEAVSLQPVVSAGLPVLTGRFAQLTAAHWAGLFVALGVIVRLGRYLLAFPLSADEYQLAANLLDRGFRELLQPLQYNQVAPLGFLWVESAVVRLFGFSELSLRLFPFLCSIASLFLFRRVAGRLLHGLPMVLAVAIFAVAYYPIRYSAEVKPYACDAFCSLLLLSLSVEWWKAPGQTRWLWWLAGLAPLALAVSFPAAFVCGGVSLGIAWTLWQQRATLVVRSKNNAGVRETRRHGDGETGRDLFRSHFARVLSPCLLVSPSPCLDQGEQANPGVISGMNQVAARPALIAWGVFNLVVAISFLGLMRLSIAAQYDATRHDMTDCWAGCFPPWEKPWQLPGWLAVVHTSEMFAYPIGAENGGSLLTALCFAVALWGAFRQPRREVAITIVAWFGISLLAAALHRYPYGGHARLSQYLAPSICLLTGSGAAFLLTKLRRPDWQMGAVRIVLIVCVIIGASTLIRDVFKPFKDRSDRDHREFARQFWNSAPDARTVCLMTDLRLTAYEGSFVTPYLCNQRIYSASHHDGGHPLGGAGAAADKPLRCVAFHSASAKKNDVVFAAWMQEMLSKYDLAKTETHEVPLAKTRTQYFDFYVMCYDVYHFEPKVKVATSGSPDRSN